MNDARPRHPMRAGIGSLALAAAPAIGTLITLYYFFVWKSPGCMAGLVPIFWWVCTAAAGILLAPFGFWAARHGLKHAGDNVAAWKVCVAGSTLNAVLLAAACLSAGIFLFLYMAN